MQFHSRQKKTLKHLISNWILKDSKNIFVLKAKEICLKKKHIDRSSEDEYNIGWSWLERWKATRVPETSFRLRLKQNIQGDEMFKAW